jgi:hypothetical protein
MDYKLNSAAPSGLPYNKPLDANEPNGQTIYGINVIVNTGIVNQTYNGFQNMDLGFCPISQLDTIDAVIAKIQVYATAFVTEKYPNT